MLDDQSLETQETLHAQPDEGCAATLQKDAVTKKSHLGTSLCILGITFGCYGNNNERAKGREQRRRCGPIESFMPMFMSTRQNAYLPSELRCTCDSSGISHGYGAFLNSAVSAWDLEKHSGKAPLLLLPPWLASAPTACNIGGVQVEDAGERVLMLSLRCS